MGTLGDQIKALALDPLFADTLVPGLSIRDSISIERTGQTTFDPATGGMTDAESSIAGFAVASEVSAFEVANSDGLFMVGDVRFKVQKTATVTAINPSGSTDVITWKSNRYKVVSVRDVLLDGGAVIFDCVARKQ